MSNAELLDLATIEAATFNVFGTAIGEVENLIHASFYMDCDEFGRRAEALRREREGIRFVTETRR